MAEEKKSFLLHADYIHVVKKLPLEKAGQLFVTILEYVNDENPVVTDMLVDVVFEPIRLQLKRDLVKWEDSKSSKSESGALGNLKRWHKDLYLQVKANTLSFEQATKIAENRKTSQSDDVQQTESQTVPNIAVNDNVNVNVNVIDIREGNDGVIPPPPSDDLIKLEKKKGSTRMLAAKKPDSVEEVQTYMLKKMKNRWDPGFCNLQAHKFFNHYETNGWKQAKGNPIVNWQAAVNLWIFRDVEKQGPVKFPAKPAQPAPALSPAIQSPTPLPEPTAEEIERKAQDFTESIFQEFKIGTVKEAGLPSSIYDLLRDRKLLVLSSSEKKQILNECSKNEILAKKKALANYFNGLIADGKENVFELNIAT